MSEPISSQPTRHQLDELEALMQRMLDLPVHPVDDAPPLAAELAATVKIEPVRLVISPPKAGSVRESFVTSSGVETPVEPKQAEKPTAPREQAGRMPLKRQPLPAENFPVSPVQRKRHPTLWYWQPLIWSNRVFDRGMGRFGRTGKWLRSPRGRAVLGWSGLLFLAAALTIGLLDAMGWTW